MLFYETLRAVLLNIFQFTFCQFRPKLKYLSNKAVVICVQVFNGDLAYRGYIFTKCCVAEIWNFIETHESLLGNVFVLTLHGFEDTLHDEVALLFVSEILFCLRKDLKESSNRNEC